MALETVDAELARQAAELEQAIPASGSSAQAEQGPAVPGAAGGPASPTDYGAEARLLVTFLCESLNPFYPSLARIYTADTQAKLVAALGPVMAKYELDFLRIFAKWEPEIRLAMVTLPLVGPTIAAVKHDLAEAKRRAAEKKAPASSEPGASPSTSDAVH